MGALNKFIALRAVGHHIRGRDPKNAVEFGPQMAGELRAMVRGNVIGHSEAGHPVTDEGSCTGLSGRVRQWYGFRPPGKAINDRKEVFHALRLIKGTHYVNMETAESMIWRWTLSERCMDMTVGLRCLAGVAFSAPLADIMFQTMPYDGGWHSPEPT